MVAEVSAKGTEPEVDLDVSHTSNFRSDESSKLLSPDSDISNYKVVAAIGKEIVITALMRDFMLKLEATDAELVINDEGDEPFVENSHGVFSKAIANLPVFYDADKIFDSAFVEIIKTCNDWIKEEVEESRTLVPRSETGASTRSAAKNAKTRRVVRLPPSTVSVKEQRIYGTAPWKEYKLMYKEHAARKYDQLIEVGKDSEYRQCLEDYLYGSVMKQEKFDEVDKCPPLNQFEQTVMAKILSEDDEYIIKGVKVPLYTTPIHSPVRSRLSPFHVDGEGHVSMSKSGLGVMKKDTILQFLTAIKFIQNAERMLKLQGPLHQRDQDLPMSAVKFALWYSMEYPRVMPFALHFGLIPYIGETNDYECNKAIPRPETKDELEDARRFVKVMRNVLQQWSSGKEAQSLGNGVRSLNTKLTNMMRSPDYEFRDKGITQNVKVADMTWLQLRLVIIRALTGDLSWTPTGPANSLLTVSDVMQAVLDIYRGSPLSTLINVVLEAAEMLGTEMNVYQTKQVYLALRKLCPIAVDEVQVECSHHRNKNQHGEIVCKGEVVGEALGETRNHDLVPWNVFTPFLRVMEESSAGTPKSKGYMIPLIDDVPEKSSANNKDDRQEINMSNLKSQPCTLHKGKTMLECTKNGQCKSKCNCEAGRTNPHHQTCCVQRKDALFGKIKTHKSWGKPEIKKYLNSLVNGTSAGGSPAKARNVKGTENAKNTGDTKKDYHDQECHQWRDKGTCTFGDDCIYRHGTRKGVSKKKKTTGRSRAAKATSNPASTTGSVADIDKGTPNDGSQ